MNDLNVLIFGSSGLVGTSLNNVLSRSSKVKEVIASKRNDTDLFNLNETKSKILKTKPDIVINAAARVGGIFANNTFRTEFILENLKINMNILESIIPFPDIKVINLGSSCIYPLNANSPIKESEIMTGKLEPTNSPYSMAKLSAIEMGRALNSQYGHSILNLMPTNLYGPNDYFSEDNSHVIPGMIVRMHKNKLNKNEKFTIWGTGNPLREFLYVDDLSDAVEFLMDKSWDYDILNVGSGEEVSINDLAKKLRKIINFECEFDYDSSKPDGNPRKLIDSTLIQNLGWKSKVDIDNGLEKTYSWYVKNLETIRN